MASNKLRIGYPGNVFEIPAPSSGMNFGTTSDNELSELDSGGRYIYEKPTTFKTFNMSWRTVTPAVQPLIDMYNKRYGNKAFYVQDLRCGEGNILPARWAYSYQLAYVFGLQGQPKVLEGSNGPYVRFTSSRYLANVQPSVTIMLHEGKPHYLMPFGSRTGTSAVRYRLYNKLTKTFGSWVSVAPLASGTAPYTVCSALETNTYSFVEIGLDIKASSTLNLEHMDFSTTDYRSSELVRRHAEGTGALRFTNSLDGELVMLRAQRIGLSVDMTEVEDK